MSEHAEPNQAGGLTLPSVLYVLFRHRWRILLFTLLGVGVGAFLLIQHRPVYQSTAKILVRYVVDSRAVDSVGGESSMRSPDSRGDGVMNSEAEILSSWDLAVRTVRQVGASKILGTTAGGTNELADADIQAAVVVARGLAVEVPRRSSVMTVHYRHPESQVAQQVLGTLVTNFLGKHFEVHRDPSAHDFLTDQATTIENTLNEKEKTLRELKEKARVLSLDTSMAALAGRSSRLQESLNEAEAQLAEQRARLDEIKRQLNILPKSVETNAPVAVSPVILEHYRLASERVAIFRRQELELLTRYTEENSQVRQVREVLAILMKDKAKLEAEHPELLGVSPLVERTAPSAPTLDLVAEGARLAALEAKTNVLNVQLLTVEQEEKKLQEYSAEITRQQREIELLETNYRYLKTAEQKASVESKLTPSDMPNIRVVQDPSTPAQDNSARIKKAVIPPAAGLVIGLLLALLTDLVFDRRVRRPSELQARYGIPVMLTVPSVRGLARLGLPQPLQLSGPSDGAKVLPSLAGGKGSGKAPAEAGEPKPGAEVAAAPWNSQFALKPYYDALRDRLMLSFQLRNMSHKPKLVAVTGCSHGAGVSTLAAGIAASLSETGEGNVLLVDMNVGRSAVHPYLQGKPVRGLQEVLQGGGAGDPTARKPETQTMVVAAADSGGGGLDRPMPQRLHHLLPQLRASDYDYIIFDMPPISDTSVTVALAASMDQILLVVEGGETQRDEVARAHAMIRPYNPNVSAICNKFELRTPKWLPLEG